MALRLAGEEFGVIRGDVAATATLDETAQEFLKTLAALYGWDGADLSRLLVESASNPNLRVRLYTAGSAVSVSAINTDGIADSQQSISVKSSLHHYNETTWDRGRGNTEATLLASAARTASTNSPDQTNYNARGVFVFFDITAVPGGDTVQLVVQGKDPASGTYQALLTGAGLSGTGFRAYAVYPGATDASSEMTDRNDLPLPRMWRARVVHSGSGSFTYSVGAVYIL